MHVIQISAYYPRPQFLVCDLVVFEVKAPSFKIGVIVGISWSVASQQWSYEIQQSGSTDEESVEWVLENDLTSVSTFLEACQISERSVPVAKIPLQV